MTPPSHDGQRVRPLDHGMQRCAKGPVSFAMAVRAAEPSGRARNHCWHNFRPPNVDRQPPDFHACDGAVAGTLDDSHFPNASFRDSRPEGPFLITGSALQVLLLTYGAARFASHRQP